MYPAGGVRLPPKTNALVDDPDEPAELRAVFKSLTSVQDEPFQDSVLAVFVGEPGAVEPPAAKAAEFDKPNPVGPFPLDVFKSLTSVHADPFQDSVIVVKSADDGFPPKVKSYLPFPQLQI